MSMLQRPADVSQGSCRKIKTRDDVMIIEGGIVGVPGDANLLSFNFGFPPKHPMPVRLRQ